MGVCIGPQPPVTASAHASPGSVNRFIASLRNVDDEWDRAGPASGGDVGLAAAGV
jgi:hypothetical protein